MQLSPAAVRPRTDACYCFLMDVAFHPITDARVPATQIPLGVLYNQNLSFGARLMYGVLSRYQVQRIMPNQTDLARDLGCTSRAVRNYLAELKAVELVTVEPHVGKSPTRYHLRFIV